MVVAKESLWKMGCCSQMEEGSLITGDTLKVEVFFHSPISLCRQNFFPGKVVWERVEHPALGEQECKDYFSEDLDILKLMSLQGSYSVQI